jgi:hypothetical protein
MKLKNPNLPYILLFVLPFLHIGLGMRGLPDDSSQGSGAAIVMPIFLIGDWIYGLILLMLLLSPTMRWRSRDQGLMVLGVVTAALWLTMMISNRAELLTLKNLNIKSLELFVFYSGPLIAYISGLLMLRRHPYVREL